MVCHDTSVSAQTKSTVMAHNHSDPLLSFSLFLHQVKNAMLAGATGIIMFSDPADYSAAGVKVQYSARLKPTYVYVNLCAYLCNCVVNAVDAEYILGTTDGTITLYTSVDQWQI